MRLATRYCLGICAFVLLLPKVFALPATLNSHNGRLHLPALQLAGVGYFSDVQIQLGNDGFYVLLSAQPEETATSLVDTAQFDWDSGLLEIPKVAIDQTFHYIHVRLHLGQTGSYGLLGAELAPEVSIFPEYSAVHTAVTDQSCLIPADAAMTAVDLNDPQLAAIYQVLAVADSSHAYALLVQQPAAFMTWINLGAYLPAAIHEVNLSLNESFAQKPCGADQRFRYFLQGNVYKTNLSVSEPLANYSIVAETIPAALKAAERYELYVTKAAGDSTQDLSALLNKLTAYLGEAWFQVQLYHSGLLDSAAYQEAYQLQLDGLVDFMVYLGYYLKSARLNHPDTYQALLNQADTLGYIQTLWTQAEQMLFAAYPIMAADVSADYLFYLNEGSASGLAHLKTVYSSEFLMELEQLGLTHASAELWDTRYFGFMADNWGL